MAFKSLKNHIGKFATPFLTDIASNFMNSRSVRKTQVKYQLNY